MVAMAAGLALSLREAAAELEAAGAELEYATATGSADTSARLSELRRRVAVSRRILASLAVLSERAMTLRDSWLLHGTLKDWRRIADDLGDSNALLQSLHDRLVSVHDFVGERLSRRMNAVLYRLTVFSTILLPITAITGLLGMNVGVPDASYRFLGSSLAFVLVVVFLCILGWLEYWYMRRRRLLLPKLDELPRPAAAQRGR